MSLILTIRKVSLWWAWNSVFSICLRWDVWAFQHLRYAWPAQLVDAQYFQVLSFCSLICSTRVEQIAVLFLAPRNHKNVLGIFGRDSDVESLSWCQVKMERWNILVFLFKLWLYTHHLDWHFMGISGKAYHTFFKTIKATFVSS